ncbi:hypothetical protein BU52_18345 [Streptomyces toyocaensis]|uniref:Secreted protein n=1 Tax=Streptomyces toyocaensis TaxID=55952 RepID=A0A081XQE4_STRTO|nr:hypothetical protein BU52_18345 [Streptomyces toyocaensis]
MIRSRRIASVAAGVLGGLALLGAGAVQAFGAEEPGGCVDDGRGTVRCVQVTEERIAVDKDGTVHHSTNGSKPVCSTSAGKISCTNDVTTKRKESTSRPRFVGY